MAANYNNKKKKKSIKQENGKNKIGALERWLINKEMDGTRKMVK